MGVWKNGAQAPWSPFWKNSNQHFKNSEQNGKNIDAHNYTWIHIKENLH
jgi:hypothetical protein